MFDWLPLIPFPYTLGLFYVFHKIGDYLCQTSWMAISKYHNKRAALVHAVAYTSVHLLLTHSPVQLAFIGATHYAIDHCRLASFLSAAINGHWHLCRDQRWKTEFAVPAPVILEIDQVSHLICNAIALFILP